MAKLEEASHAKSISICDVMKGNTSELIKKMEMQNPTISQIYSDIYKEYLHGLDEMYGICYISEKEFFDKLNIDQNTLLTIDNFWKSVVKTYSDQIDIYTNFMRNYGLYRVSSIKSYDNNYHIMIGIYAKLLSQFNSMLEYNYQK